MLGPGEQIQATIGGPGPSIQRPMGEERVWYQLAVTDTRVLAVRLVQGPVGGSYQPAARLATGKSFLRVRRFPRTSRSTARLELEGFGEDVTLVDIDDSKVFPYVEPFLAAWGGVVEGAGQVQQRAPDPIVDATPRPNRKMLLAVVAAGFVMVGGCCGLSMMAVVVQWIVATL